MPESPHPGILNREEAQRLAQEHFSPQLALLRDLANYGSNLVLRAYGSSPKTTEDVVVCGVLLKQIVAMVDAVEVMLSVGIAQAAFLPARAAFEASLYIDWILLGDSERKAQCYIVSDFRDERKWALRTIHGTPEEEDFTSVTKSFSADIHAAHPTLLAEAEARLVEVDRILAQADLAPIDAEFDNWKKKRKTDVAWYVLTGKNSIRQIADAVQRLPEYEMFYSRGSSITHTASYKDHVRFRNSQVRLKQVRHVAEFRDILNFLVAFSIRAYCNVLTKYRPGELPAFWKKYKDEWRDPFLNVKNVIYAN
jgi:hypothetical protein